MKRFTKRQAQIIFSENVHKVIFCKMLACGCLFHLNTNKGTFWLILISTQIKSDKWNRLTDTEEKSQIETFIHELIHLFKTLNHLIDIERSTDRAANIKDSV